MNEMRSAATTGKLQALQTHPGGAFRTTGHCDTTRCTSDMLDAGLPVTGSMRGMGGHTNGR